MEPKDILRALAPAPGPDQDHNSSLGLGSHDIKKPRNASVACRKCKQIRKRCDQNQPCGNCVKTSNECIFDQAEDGRRKVARKRSLEELELKRDALDSFVDLVRSSDDDFHIKRVLDLIRGDGSLKDIAIYAKNHASGGPEDYETPPDSEAFPAPKTRKTVLSIAALCDTPLIHAPASPWTTVTDNDDFVSHLLSLYFTWIHGVYPSIDRDVFVDSMAEGKATSNFCSPVLVNAILSLACHFSDRPQACKIPGNPDTRGQHFFDEASRLWTAEQGRPKLTNIQAAHCLSIASTLMGKDRISWNFLSEMNRMGDELTYRNLRQSQGDIQDEVPAAVMKRSMSLALWTSYLIFIGYGISFMKIATAKRPKVERAFVGPELEKTTKWVPYPREQPSRNVASNAIFEVLCDLHLIAADLQQCLFGDDNTGTERDSSALVVAIDQRLLAWLHRLPSSCVCNESNFSPPLMDLHLWYHWLRITLFNFAKSPPNGTPPPVDGLDVMSYARREVRESAKSLGDLFDLFERYYGSPEFTINMPQTACSAAFSIIDDLDRPEMQEVFHKCCQVLFYASRRWMAMKGHVRMLYITVQAKAQNVPEKTTELLRITASKNWSSEDHLKFSSSAYPNYAVAKETDPWTAGMGDLLEQWADLNLDNQLEIKDKVRMKESSPSAASEESNQGSPAFSKD